MFRILHPGSSRRKVLWAPGPEVKQSGGRDAGLGADLA